MIRTKFIPKLYFCNFYKRLNVQEDAQAGDIKNNFIKLAKKHHPDVGQISDDQFVKIKQAYDTLKDPNLRKQYDYQLIHGKRSEGHRQYKNYYSEQNQQHYYSTSSIYMTLVKLGFVCLACYFITKDYIPMTEHQIRRQNLILSLQSQESTTSIKQRRRKQLMKEMEQKKITTKVVQLKVSNGHKETQKSKMAKKSSIESIPGVKKQVIPPKYESYEQYM